MDTTAERVFTGLVAMWLAPAFAAGLLSFVALLVSGQGGAGFWALMVMGGILVFATPSTAIFALLVIWLSRTRRFAPQWCASLGAALGVVSGFTPRLVTELTPGLSSPIFWLGVAPAAGAISALVFWLVAFRGMSPNNSSKPTPLRGAA